MERRLCIKNYTSAGVSALTYLPVRREIVAGFEDGLLKCWELDTGRATGSNHKHKGWVSQLLYWAEGKVMFSASLDGTVVQWSSSFEPYYTVELPGPIYCIMWNTRKDQLVCGRKGCLGLLSLSGKMASNGLPLLSTQERTMDGHTDIVKCLGGHEGKAYSAGFDRKLIVYEVSLLPGAPPLRPISINHHAHDAGISSMLVTNDADSTTLVATGSFDEKVKVWTSEGKLLVCVSCQSVVTGICYMPTTKVMWVAAGMPTPIFIEPKIGVNVSQFVPVMGDSKQEKSTTGRAKSIQTFSYFPDIAEVLGFSNQKEILSWKYSISNAVCIQKSPASAHIETITYTKKSPILIFTATYDGMVTRWEKHQINSFVYNTEEITYKEKLWQHLCSEESEWNMLEVVGDVLGKAVSNAGMDVGRGRMVVSDKAKARCREELLKEDFRGFVKSLYVESLDYLIASALDGRIFVWGYDDKSVDMLIQMQMLENGRAEDTPSFENKETVMARVAGMSCLQVLNGHSSTVSGLALVEKQGIAYLVSASWDCSVCVWDLSEMSLVSCTKHMASSACSLTGDAIIMDMDYSPDCDMIGYCTSDGGLYLCPFTTKQSGLKVKATLLGHHGEVTQVKWNRFMSKWVTGSEDGTIRIWPADGKGGSCDMVVTAGGPVNIVTIDETHGFILAAIGNVIKLFDQQLEVVQISRGHTDSIQCILHVPEVNLYFSCGWDKSLRIWKAYKPRQTTTS